MNFQATIKVGGPLSLIRRCRSWLTPALCLSWLLLVAAGLRQVQRYENTPGAAALAPPQWPVGAVPAPASDRVALLMIVHPRCPCSRASLAELAQLMAHCRGQVAATVLFVQYAGVSDRWVRSGTWRQASAIPGVRVVCDPDGASARRLGARTSGQTYLYDAQGRLLFSGGLTGARGHEGDNAGLSAALARLRGHSLPLARTSVFGCPLFNGMEPESTDCHVAPRKVPLTR